MQAFSFNRAIVRAPGHSVVHGLHSEQTPAPSYESLLKEHAAYVIALRDAGLEIDVLPPLEPFPDSVFVEDPALVLPEGAILLRPGAPSRAAERDEMRPVLRRHFERVLELGEGEFVDGGDILVTPRIIFIGLSKRTNRAGAEAIRERLVELGHIGRVVATPDGVLHFKTAAALLSDDTILATPVMAASGVFAEFRIVLTPEGEEAAANALRLNNVVLVGAHYPRTIELLARQGLDVKPISVREVAKLDAGLSCMSLRWHNGTATTRASPA